MPNEKLLRGDMVQLKTPEQGRYFTGRIRKEIGNEFLVDLPNGLYVIRPKHLWILCDTQTTYGVPMGSDN